MQIKTIKELKKEIIGDPFFGRSISFALDNIGDISGKKIVDVGCGNGEMSVFFALRGANVVGIDIEASVLEEAKALALKRNIKDECIFLNVSAESMPIESSSIDIIFSKSTIQYMNREDVLTEYNRIIKPDGIIVLLENLPFNPFINIYRLRRRLFAKTSAEVQYVNSVRGYLTFTEIENFKSSFQEVIHKEYHLFSMFAIYLLPSKSKPIKNIYSLLIRLDNLLLDRVYFTRYLAWYTAVICRNKRVSDEHLLSTR